jgi:hypothetical protein
MTQLVIHEELVKLAAEQQQTAHNAAGHGMATAIGHA